MGEEASTGDCVGLPAATCGCGDDGRVLEWVEGLPSDEELTPLSQTLITQELASAFSITPEPPRTFLDVCRASKDTITTFRRQMPNSASSSAQAPGQFASFSAAAAAPEDPIVIEGDESAGEEGSGCSSNKVRFLDAAEEADSPPGTENPNFDTSARMQKRSRLVWTSQLHKRFVEVVSYLGEKNAVPKAIMQLMNVEGLTRENVASHLQKYRLYLKRMQAFSTEGPSSPDHPLASTPEPQGLHETPASVRMSFAPPPALIPLPVLGMAQNVPGARIAMVPANGQGVAGEYHGFEAHHPYAVFEERQKVGTSGNKFCPMVPYPRVSPNDKY